MRFYLMAGIVVLATAILSVLNYWLLERCVTSLRGRRQRQVYLLLTLFVLVILACGWSRRPPFSFAPEWMIWAYLATDWVLGQGILFLFQPVIFLMRRLLGSRQRAEMGKPVQEPVFGRRCFLQGAFSVTPLVAFGISTNSIVEAQSSLAVIRHTLSMSNLPAGLAGFKIAQISDTHLGAYFSLSRWGVVLEKVAQEKPDLVVVTGDFIDDLSLLTDAVRQLAELQAIIPDGVYFCLGNHDYFRDVRQVRRTLQANGIQILDNAAVLIRSGERPFYLMGIDYPWEDLYRSGIKVSEQRRREYFQQVQQQVPAEAFKVFIAHHPDSLLDGFAAGIPLTLAGHTHGGQVVLAGKSPLDNYQYMRGLYAENGVYGYVSRGAGHWVPIRLGCPPEVSIFTLQD